MAVTRLKDGPGRRCGEGEMIIDHDARRCLDETRRVEHSLRTRHMESTPSTPSTPNKGNMAEHLKHMGVTWVHVFS